MLKNLFTQFKPLFIWLFWLTLIIVSYLLLIEIQPSQPTWPHVDKVIHSTMFLTLGVLGYIAYAKHKYVVWIGLALYGIATECLQNAVTETRIGNIHDWLADFLGIMLSMLLIYFIQSINTKKR